jgi:hypothetical protein
LVIIRNLESTLNSLFEAINCGKTESEENFLLIQGSYQDKVNDDVFITVKLKWF